MSISATYHEQRNFENNYIRLRRKEGHIYSDEEVAILPEIYKSHPHYKEWLIRKRSCRALLSYIKKKDTVLTILDVCCGNGWLAAQLATVIDAEVTGLDTKTSELKQARRVFYRIPGLNFIQGDIERDDLKDKKFDLIIFAASIQFYASLKEVIAVALEHLTMQGEIHIMDSPFYQQQELEAARQKTKVYFSSLGFAEMAQHYHHHTLSSLNIFQYKILHHPYSWKNKLAIKKNPFYWIVIKNRYH